ncbi:hypothetical protein [Mesorhizobium ciceri]|uniref:hypothetical protein n=1 Tax=Mesorhizobium TaxID=68287 RepID=UPI00047A27BB|nr:hypothetical protein [Mesorhizobium ciceri]
MNAAAAISRQPEPYADTDWRIVTRIFGGLLGTDFIVSTGGATYRVGALTIGQLERGIPPQDLDMLEVDPDTYEAL